MSTVKEPPNKPGSAVVAGKAPLIALVDPHSRDASSRMSGVEKPTESVRDDKILARLTKGGSMDSSHESLPRRLLWPRRFRGNQSRKVLAAVFTLILNLTPGFALRAAVMRFLGFRVGSNVALHSWLRLFDIHRNVTIGSNVTINPGCYLDNRMPIIIGDNVNISHDVKIYTLGHDVDDPMCKAVGASVVIHDNVWIFPNVLIMPGVTIGRGAVVYPGSVVTKSVGPLEVVGGNPARKIRMRKGDIRYRVDYRIWFAR
jgi:acetyltransferase-like isoleucine patch superfamily enzyme